MEAELEPLRQPSARWRKLTGAEQRRQHALAMWAQHLRVAADDFSKLRSELEAMMRHRSARLAERMAARDEGLQAALAQAANLYGPQAEPRLADVSTALATIERPRRASPRS